MPFDLFKVTSNKFLVYLLKEKCIRRVYQNALKGVVYQNVLFYQNMHCMSLLDDICLVWGTNYHFSG